MKTEVIIDSNVSADLHKPWYRRPCRSGEPDGFAAMFAQTITTLDTAASNAPCVLASSLSAEDMVLFHLIVRERLPIHTFALDTERLPKATDALWLDAEAHYGREIERIHPAPDRLHALSVTQTNSAIFESKSARELCCTVRKTEPLRRTLAGKSAWVTGLRKAQSVARARVPHEDWDPVFELKKFNPLADWPDEALWYFIDREAIPVSRLYDKGYASIGCDPCTRPIRAHEHPRAGRWWWETEAIANGSATECGIHITPTANSKTESTQPMIKVTT